MLLALTLTVSTQATGGTIHWDDSHDTDGDELSGNFEHGNLLWKRIYRNGELIKSE